jgi:hypothetical protein
LGDTGGCKGERGAVFGEFSDQLWAACCAGHRADGQRELQLVDTLVISKDVPKVFIRVCEECWMPYPWKYHDNGHKPKYCKNCQYVVAGRHQKEIKPLIDSICAECNSPFKAKRKSKKFCSKKCAHRNHQKNLTVRLDCAFCGKVFMRNNGDANKSKNKKRIFCGLECMFAAKIKDVPGTNVFGSVRKWFSRFGRMKECSRCHYSEEPGILVLHHKDRNRENNAMDNLEVLCPNCHTLEHYQENKNGWKHRSSTKAYLRMLKIRGENASS